MKYLFLMCILLLSCQSNIDSKSSNSNAIENITQGEYQVHYLYNNKNSAWLSYIPKILDKNKKVRIVVTGMNGNLITNDYQDIIDETIKVFKKHTGIVNGSNLVYICPVIKRNKEPYLYEISLNKKTLEMGYFKKYQRADYNLIEVIKILKNSLYSLGILYEDKVIIEGFSASATFAQRFSLLHPEYVYAIIVGQCGGSLTLPFEKLEDKNLQWPLGIYDIKKYINSNFNEEDYSLIHQYIYIGSYDINNSMVEIGNNDNFSNIEIEYLDSKFGNNDPERLKMQTSLLVKKFTNIEFKIYNGMRHTQNNAVINDIWKYIQKIQN